MGVCLFAVGIDGGGPRWITKCRHWCSTTGSTCGRASLLPPFYWKEVAVFEDYIWLATFMDRLESYTWQREEGNEKTAANRTRASNLQTYSWPLSSWAKVATSIQWFLNTSVGVLYPEAPLKFPHQLMINTRFLLLWLDGLCTMVNGRQARGLHIAKRRLQTFNQIWLSGHNKHSNHLVHNSLMNVSICNMQMNTVACTHAHTIWLISGLMFTS